VRIGDALSPLHSIHPQETIVERNYGRLKSLGTRAALSAAALVMSATLLIAVLGAFYTVSSEAVLADSPEARSAVADCEAREHRAARQNCVKRLVARAQARDAGASQLATVAARQRRAAQ
jgi:hypothetical protein